MTGEDMTTMPQPEVLVTVGVDTHADTHVGVALDQLGRDLGTITVETTPCGYRRLLAWASSFGIIDRFGIEGTGCWGSGLARWLHTQGLVVIEVDRPNRRARRRYGKSDPADARAAARAVQSGEATGTPKAGDGVVEAIRTLQVPYRTAIKARSQAANQLHALVVTAPEPLRGRLHDLRLRELVETAARLRPGPELDSPAEATKQALRLLARRYRQLDAEAVELTRQLHTLVVAAAPQLLAEQGVGTHVAATLLVTAGDNPERLHSESSFAHLCGVAPLDASSGKQLRHRLNPGGDRQANSALHTVAIVRMSHDPTTRAYVARRLAEGKTKREAIRCLKRYLARRMYHHLTDITHQPALDKT
jgi:transposase